METRGERNNSLGLALKLIFMAVVFLAGFNFIRIEGKPFEDNSMLQNFSTVFISIILEALPFILLGSFVSALIQVFVSEEFITRFIPKNRFLGLIMASLLGVFFPVCECAIVPITRRLIKKGVPVGIALTFMLAVPIVNPVVLASTYYAFHDMALMVLVRGGFGLIGAITIGFIVDWMRNSKSPMKQGHIHDKHHHDCGHGHGHNHHHEHHHESRISEIVEHTSIELYDIGKFLIIGAMISSFFQVFVSRGYILKWGQNTVWSIIAMMLLAYIISLCSEADAFIARTFLGQFTTGSIAAFLILGPMIDIKNTLLLISSFKKRFVIQLIFVIFSVVFIIGALINMMGI